MNSKELHDFAEEVIEEALDIIDGISDKNISFWRRPSTAEIDFLLTTIGQLSTIVLNGTGNCVRLEEYATHLNAEIDNLQREKLKLILDNNHLEAKLEQATENPTSTTN